jgi:hypothetical protein
MAPFALLVFFSHSYTYISISHKLQLLNTDIHWCLQIKGIINQVLKPSKVRTQSRLRVYNTIAVPTIFHTVKLTTQNEQVKYIMRRAEIKILRKTAKQKLWNFKRNQDILKELKAWAVLVEINRLWQWMYKTFRSMGRSCVSQARCDEMSNGGIRRAARLLNRLLDCYIETGRCQEI